jgi:hypothetical protein
MKTAAAIEDSRACASPAHRCIGSSRQWSFRRPRNAASIAPFLRRIIEIAWQFEFADRDGILDGHGL